MKEVIVIIRPKMYFVTKKALNDAGFHSMVVKEVIGRGKHPIQYDLDDGNTVHNRLVAKKMINMYVVDEEVDFLIKTVIEANKTNHAGDGKIFILPADNAVRVRTGQTGNEALL